MLNNQRVYAATITIIFGLYGWGCFPETEPSQWHIEVIIQISLDKAMESTALKTPKLLVDVLITELVPSGDFDLQKSVIFCGGKMCRDKHFLWVFGYLDLI